VLDVPGKKKGGDKLYQREYVENGGGTLKKKNKRIWHPRISYEEGGGRKESLLKLRNWGEREKKRVGRCYL